MLFDSFLTQLINMLACFRLSLIKSLPGIHKVLHFLKFSLRAPLHHFELAKGELNVFEKIEDVPIGSLDTGQVSLSQVAQILGWVANFDIVRE